MKKLSLILTLSLIVFSTAMAEQKNVKVLISKPNNFNYTVDKKTVWVPTIVEALAYFRLNAVNGLSVVTPKDIDGKIEGSRDYNKRISKNKYNTAAKELHASHLLYIEYEATNAKEATVYFSLMPVGNPAAATKKQISITVTDINSPVTEVISQLLDVVGVPMDKQPSEFYGVDVVGANPKSIAKLGTILSEQSNKSISEFGSIATAAEDVNVKDTEISLATYSASMLYTLAGSTDNAARCIRQLAGTFGTKYPKLQLELARTYSSNGKWVMAQRTIDRLTNDPSIKKEVLWERGIIYLGLGQTDVAFQSFNELKELDPNNGALFVYLANLSFSQNKTAEGEGHVKTAAKITGKSEAIIYSEIGASMLKTEKKDQSVKVLEKAVAMDPGDDKILVILADAYAAVRNDNKAAEAYVKLYDLDYLKYADQLKKGCDLYVRLGQIPAAKAAYTAAFQKTSSPELAIAIADLESKDNNCDAVNKLLGQLASPFSDQENVKAMLLKCSEAKNGPTVTIKGKKIDTLSAGSAYVDAGATALDTEDGDLTSSITKKGTVNNKVPGTYEILYSSTDASGNISTGKRVVVVIDDKAPEMSLIGESPLQLAQGSAFVDPGVKAIDNVDGDISSKAVVSGTVDNKTLGTYNLGYEVTDAAGNSNAVIRTVNVYDPSKPVDRMPPIIKLIGGSPTVIKMGTVYEEPGVNATDETDGDVTAMINIEGEVDYNTPGKYEIIYTAVDKSGNKAEKRLRVTVTGEKKPIASSTPSSTTPVSDQMSQSTPASESRPDIRSAGMKKSPRKPILAAITGVGTVGSAIAGILMNKKANDLYTTDWASVVYKDTDGSIKALPGKEQDKKDIESEITTSLNLRNAFYGIAGGFGLLFVVNIAIPSK